jgi:uncharacterized protein (DUF362 family)/Pyruvate/2-oxoacid:ferredoxin oxidoreductase delta subunit
MPDAPSLIAFQRCPDYAPAPVSRAVRSALEALPGLPDLARSGRRVLLKPNIVNPRAPETAACTHPSIMRAVAEFFHDAGCALLVADQPTYARPDQTEEVFAVPGYRAALADLPVQWSLASARGYEPYPVPHPLQTPTVHLSRLLREVDFVVNLAKLKTHMQTRMTGAVKNVFGLVAPRQRLDLHALGLARLLGEALADCWGAAPPALTVMDAVLAQEGPGPIKGHPRPLGWLAAATDGVALDALAASLTGFRPGEILPTHAAARAGYGQDDLARLELSGDDPDPLRARLRRAPSLTEHVPPWLAGFGMRWVYVRPRVNPRRCVNCGQCLASCPASCLHLAEHARIDRRRCLECFCCMEACPHDAIEVERGPLNRFA